MKPLKFLRFAAFAAISALSAFQSHGIDIDWNFEYDTGEFWTEEERLVLDLVAQQFEGLMIDTPDLSGYASDVSNFRTFL